MKAKINSRFLHTTQKLSLSAQFLLCLFLFFAFTEIGRTQNPVVWPYGGTPDSSRYEKFGSDAPSFLRSLKVPLNFFSKATFIRAKFDSATHFYNAIFNDETNFVDASFKDDANFNGAVFKDRALFSNTLFSKVVDFDNAQFDSLAYFYRTRFLGISGFGGTQFNGEAIFTDAHFKSELILEGAVFKKGIDFRRASFDSLEKIFLEDIQFPIGQFKFHWEQFKAKNGKPRISLFDDYDYDGRHRARRADDLRSRYNRIEIIYHKLRDNFLEQGDEASADEVMFELGWQKERELGEFKQKLYGWLFGYGYQPWRFLLFVVLPIIVIFSIFWYFKYSEVLWKVIFMNEMEAAKRLASELSFAQKAWYSLIFSSSVLLGIRFKKEWVVKYKNYLFWVTLEWALGIGLYIAFALLVKGSRFDFIKGLLGF